MITIYGEGRGFRVIWLLEEMGLPYRLRSVDLLAGVENDPEFLAINPGGFIPALVDGDVTMVESIAIMEYLIARYGQDSTNKLAPAPHDPSFGLYQQFLHLGEAGLGANIQVVVVSGFVAPESERDNWGARWALDQFNNRMKLVKRQLARALYGRRQFHRRRHFGDLHAEPRHKTRRHRSRRNRKSLHGPHHRPRRLSAHAGCMPRHEGILRFRPAAMIAPSAERWQSNGDRIPNFLDLREASA